MAKEKMAVYFQPETIKKIEQEYKEDNCASKTEFIEKAVKFYIGYLRQQEEVNYLSPLITETVKAQIKYRTAACPSAFQSRSGAWKAVAYDCGDK